MCHVPTVVLGLPPPPPPPSYPLSLCTDLVLVCFLLAFIEHCVPTVHMPDMLVFLLKPLLENTSI